MQDITTIADYDAAIADMRSTRGELFVRSMTDPENRATLVAEYNELGRHINRMMLERDNLANG